MQDTGAPCRTGRCLYTSEAITAGPLASLHHGWACRSSARLSRGQPVSALTHSPCLAGKCQRRTPNLTIVFQYKRAFTTLSLSCPRIAMEARTRHRAERRKEIEELKKRKAEEKLVLRWWVLDPPKAFCNVIGTVIVWNDQNFPGCNKGCWGADAVWEGGGETASSTTTERGEKARKRSMHSFRFHRCTLTQ